MNNLVHTLLAHASRREEDAITATLAWLVGAHAPLRTRWQTYLMEHGAPQLTGDPVVRTQVTEGSNRYDLVLVWPGWRAVIEVKVRAGLGWRSTEEDSHDDETAPRVVSQVRRYLQHTERTQPPTGVFTLAADELELEPAVRAHPRFGGALRWQDVRQWLTEEEPTDPVVAQVARWFVDVLRRRGMTFERLTAEGLASVGPYLAFKASLDAMIDRVWTLLRDDPRVKKLQRDDPWRQEAHARIGWAAPYDRRVGMFAFVGISVHPLATRDGAPDLLLFLEAPPTKPAAQHIQRERAAWEAACARLNEAGHARWALGTGWPLISATRDMGTLLDEPDQVGAMVAFFRACLEALDREGLLDRYLAAHASHG